jgi:hypothetical protein
MKVHTRLLLGFGAVAVLACSLVYHASAALPGTEVPGFVASTLRGGKCYTVSEAPVQCNFNSTGYCDAPVNSEPCTVQTVLVAGGDGNDNVSTLECCGVSSSGCASVDTVKVNNCGS